MTFITLALLSAAAVQAAPGRTPMPQTAPVGAEAQAQTGTAVRVPSPPAVGANVLDTAGGTVGRIESITNGVAVIDTGAAKVGYPLTSMTAGPNGPIIAVTKTQLEANHAEQMAKTQAELKAKLVAGTPVKSLNGSAQLGTIKAVDAEFVTLTSAKGDVRLPITGFSTDAQGGVIVGLTADQFNAAMGGAK